jgi:hypothetical protein
VYFGLTQGISPQHFHFGSSGHFVIDQVTIQVVNHSFAFVFVITPLSGWARVMRRIPISPIASTCSSNPSTHASSKSACTNLQLQDQHLSFLPTDAASLPSIDFTSSHHSAWLQRWSIHLYREFAHQLEEQRRIALAKREQALRSKQPSAEVASTSSAVTPSESRLPESSSSYYAPLLQPAEHSTNASSASASSDSPSHKRRKLTPSDTTSSEHTIPLLPISISCTTTTNSLSSSSSSRFVLPPKELLPAGSSVAIAQQLFGKEHASLHRQLSTEPMYDRGEFIQFNSF